MAINKFISSEEMLPLLVAVSIISERIRDYMEGDYISIMGRRGEGDVT
jgi:hypothetical protein